MPIPLQNRLDARYPSYSTSLLLRTVRIFLLLSLVFAGSALILVPGYGQAVTVGLGTLDPATGGIRVPAGFVGFAYDWNSVTNYIADGATFSNYLHNISILTGPPSLRVGGNQTSYTYVGNSTITNEYNYFSNPVSSSYLGITTNSFTTVAAFVKSNGLSAILEVNGAAYNTQPTAPQPANSAPQIQWVQELTNAWSAVGMNSLTNLVIELGNEPDHWDDPSAGRSFRDTNWSPSSYQSNVDSLAIAIRGTAGIGTLSLEGPTYGGQPLTATSFINSTTVTLPNLITSATLNEVAVHYYAHSAASSLVTNLTTVQQIQLLLLGMYTNATSTNDEISPYSSGAETGPQYSNVIASVGATPIRIGEMNTFVSGLTNVSDAFVSALWAADTLGSFSRTTLSGINMNSAWSALETYNVLVDSNNTPNPTNQLTAQATYYGMYFFGLAAQNGGVALTNSAYTNDFYLATHGTNTPTTSNPWGSNGTAASAYYFRDTNGNLRILAINRSNYTVGGNYTFSFNLANASNYSSVGSLLLLTDNSTNGLADTNPANYQIGGQTFNPSTGLINTNWGTTNIGASNSSRTTTFSFGVPGGSAGIFTVMALSQGPVTLSISNTFQTYDGTAKSVTVSESPNYNLPIGVTYSNASYGPTTNAPTNLGSYTVVAAVSNAVVGSTATNTLIIASPPVITSPASLVGVVGTQLSYQITATNYPVSYGATGLPSGLSVDPNTGLIYGMPGSSGTNQAVIFASDINGVTGSATLTIDVVTTLSALTTTYTNSAGTTNSTNISWICPANVSSVQVQCWGGGGAGGGALRNPNSGSEQYGGGGAGGAYAMLSNYPVTPGTTYIISVGGGGVTGSSWTNGQTFSGGDSWINTSTNEPTSGCLAKGGAGGFCANTNTSIIWAGGVASTNGCLGNVFYPGGSGANGSSTAAFGGGGGGSAGTNGSGNSATNGSGLGASSVSGGGNGGKPNATANVAGPGQAPTTLPGGGGGGARASSLQAGGNGAPGQVIVTVVSLGTSVSPATITLSNTNQVYTGLAEPVSLSVSPTNATPILLTYSNNFYPLTTNAPTNVGSYSVTAGITNTSYIGSSTATLTINAATPQISFIGSTNDPYNGYPWGLSTTISPGGIPVSISYNGGTNLPVAVGSYTVVASNSADSVNSNWTASSTNTVLTVYDPVSQWRQAYYGTTNNSGLAASTAVCGNGLNNNAAYTFGINPTSSVTSPLLAVSNAGSNMIVISFTAQAAGAGPGYSGLSRYYSLLCTTNVENSNSWSVVPGYSDIAGSNQTVSFTTNTTGGPKWFYMLKAWLQ